MPYSAEISRTNPGCIMFVIDQSGSMSEHLDSSTRAGFVSDALNRVLQDLVIRCSKEEVYDYFDIGVIGYGSLGPVNGMTGSAAQNWINPISLIANNPARVEDRYRKISDGAGGLIEVQQKFPVWFEPVSNGGTPMVAALTIAGQRIADWADAHEQSFPPILIHLTDGESTDGDPEPVAEVLKLVSTADGNALILNLHVSNGEPISFPDSEIQLDSEFSRKLFRMSSVLPPGMRGLASTHGYSLSENSRGFILNAGAEQIVQLFEIGTRPANLR